MLFVFAPFVRRMVDLSIGFDQLGLMLIGPIWIMLWHTKLYLWEYPAEDLLPLVMLAIVPAGRYRGYDSQLATRFGRRWPF